MIKNLLIKNLAIIKEALITIDDGFIVLTGETGAGKSIVLDALKLIGGCRAESEIIGAFGQKCIVEANFELTKNDCYLRLQLSSQAQNHSGKYLRFDLLY